MADQSLNNAYKNLVELNYQLYNGLFLTLPFDAVEQTGLLLPLLEEAGQAGLDAGLNPAEIIDQFFDTHRPHISEEDRLNLLFKIIQYVERQIVLVDALEDAAFSEIHQTETSNVLRKLTERVVADRLQAQFEKLLTEFGAKVILTAHPTQFYPGPVLAIITDLVAAIQASDQTLARNLLQQLGNTPFFKKTKPTPFEEAVQLSWYLGNIFYPSIGEIIDRLDQLFEIPINSELLSIGFWPGGDRDGNPYVTTETTLRVARKLRAIILSCYHSDIRELKRRLSFAGVYDKLEAIEKQFHLEITNEIESCYRSIDTLLEKLDAIEKLLLEKYQGLFVDRLRSFRRKIRVFGFHFACLDIRQDSRVLARVLDAVIANNPTLLPANFEQFDSAEQISVS